MKFNLLPLKLAYSDEKVGTIRLMNHQAETLNCEANLITINAPTGGGKTLAFLSRIVKSCENGIIVLPTNELIEDQAQSICDLLQKMERSVFVPTTKDFSSGSFGNGEDYAVVVATGSRLEELANISGRCKGTALAELLSVNTNNILLVTNPDTIHLLFRGKYARSKEIFQDLIGFKIVVIDEFHLYYGTTLTNLLFMLWALRNCVNQLIIATATPSDILYHLKTMFPQSKEISAKVDSDGYPARHNLQLEITSLPQNGGLRDHSDAEKVATIIKELYEKYKFSDAPTKVLAIVNSIAFCIRLEKRLKNDLGIETVSAIHSLIPATDRGLLRKRPVIIGTSALEVGIDFDVSSVLVEANTAPAFLQRIGRAARKREAEGIAMIPPEAVLYFQEHTNSTRLDYGSFSELVYSSLPTLSTYTGFLKSKEAASLYAGFLYGLLILSEESRQRDSLIRCSKDAFWRMPIMNLLELETISARFPVKMLAKIAETGFRGFLTSFPAYFEKFQKIVRIGFFDLPMLRIKEISTKERIGISDRKITKDEPIPVVEEFTDTPFKFRARWDKCFFRNIWNIAKDNLSLNVGDPHYDSLFFKLIEGQPAFATATKPDWRFASIKHETENEWIVIGLDAYLQKYLDSRWN